MLFLYGCKIWSLTLREENIFKMFENRVLRRIFGSKRREEHSIMKSFIIVLLTKYY
jgi:hypothetical protein